MKRGTPRRIVEALARTDLRSRSVRGRGAGSARVRATELAGAAARGELVLHYQPIVDLRSGACHRVEALLRWRHPRLGLLLPGDFLAEAEASGQLSGIGRWVLATASRQLRDWRAQGERIGIAVNVSGADLVSGAALDELLSALRPLEPGALTCELTAATLAVGDDAQRLALRRLGSSGVRISLDDLVPSDAPGHGLAADLDEVKLSRSLVRRAAAEPAAAAEMRGLIELARDFRLVVVAVGVEDRQIRDAVAALGCDLAQGFWVSRPLVADRLAPWRRWAVGLAFGGAVAFSAQAGGRAAGSHGGLQAPSHVAGFLPTLCCLDLASTDDGARAGSVVEMLRQRTGLGFVERQAARADVFLESGVSSSVGRDLVAAVDRDVEEIEREFGHSMEGRPAIYVFATRANFALGLQQVFGVRGADAGILAAANGGITLPRQGAIVINLQNVPAGDRLAIVRHELTHAMVHQVIGPSAELPAWFDEGLATLQERSLRPDEGSDARAAAAALSLLSQGKGALADLHAPAEWAQRNAALDGRAYAVSAEAVRLLEQRVSHDGVLRILDAVGGGASFAAAYAREAGESLGDFERAFPARLAAEHEGARIAVTPTEDGVRWSLVGFKPSSSVSVTIESAGYRLQYAVTTDRHGMYQAVFGSTAPPGEYTLSARAPGAAAEAVMRTDRSTS